MTAVNVDLIASLQESLEADIDTITGLKGKSTYIYSPAQLSLVSQSTHLPHVFYYYAGIIPDGKTHKCMFDLFLFAPAKSLTKIAGNVVMPTATALLQSLRKAIACDRPGTQRVWELLSEVPNFNEDDYLTYMQRWASNCQIKN